MTMYKIQTLRIALLTTIVCVSGLHAEIVEIPLPGLHGFYPGDSPVTREALFSLDRPIEYVHGAWLKLAGGATVGAFECWDDYIGGPCCRTAVVIAFTATMRDSTTGGFWIAGGNSMPEPGPFDSKQGFFPILHPTWDFLLDGEGIITLVGYPTEPALDECYMITPYPDAIVDEVILILDVDFRVPVESSTWGSIKALYSE